MMGTTDVHAPPKHSAAAPIALAAALGLCAACFQVAAFDMQGHRGARGLMPENTLAGFDYALRLGVTTLEMDLGVTKDGQLIVYHDSRLRPALTRGPDGEWIQAPGPAINSLSLHQLMDYDVGSVNPTSPYARRFPEQRALDGERIPTLAQVLALGPRSGNNPVQLNIETKLSPRQPHMTPSPRDFARRVVTQVRGARATGRVTVQSFDWRSLLHVQSLAPEIKTSYLTAEQPWLDNVQRGRPDSSPWTAGMDVDEFGGSVPRMIKQAGGRVWSPHFRDLDGPGLTEAHALGLRVIVWTVNEVPDMRHLIALGVDGIITDYPNRLREVLRQLGMNRSNGQ